jgi:hypothetical protein
MTKSVLALSIAAIVSIPFAAKADLITGVLNFTGEAVISSTIATPGSIAFASNTFTVQPSFGGFATLDGTTGTIANITNPPDAVDVPLDQPFITFTIAPDITITLTEVLAGIDGESECAAAPAAGEVCTPAPPITTDLSPYNLQDTSTTTSSASFNIIGFETDSATATSIGVVGSFSDPSVDMSYQAILAEIATPGGSFTTPFSAQISTDTTPEPSSLLELMMGIGLVGLSFAYRKKLKRT